MHICTTKKTNIMKTYINDKLIAEFTQNGATKHGYYYKNGKEHNLYELKFLNWDWLMEVVDKIESLEDVNRCCRYNVNIEQCYVEIIENHTSNEIVKIDGENKKEAIYDAVVEFIKIYNREKEIIQEPQKENNDLKTFVLINGKDAFIKDFKSHKEAEKYTIDHLDFTKLVGIHEIESIDNI